MKRSNILALITFLLIFIIYSFDLYLNQVDNFLIYLSINLISIFSALLILLSNKKVEVKIAWAVFVMMIPIGGVLLYLIFGTHYNSFSKQKRKNYINSIVSSRIDLKDKKIKKLKKEYGNLFNIMENVGAEAITHNNIVKILHDGPEKFKYLFKDLNNAKTFINIEYFIIKEGILYDEFKEILIRKAKEGIKIRVIVDDFGCIDFPYSEKRLLRKYGITIVNFNELNFKLFRTSINYRNHRKIVVIDNVIGYVGGINIGDEYINLNKYYGHWRDVHLRIEGEGASELNKIFIRDWYTTAKESLISEQRHMIKGNYGTSSLQILADGPDNSAKPIKTIYYKLITSAKKSVTIVTPYLILNDEILQALKISALSGVEVKIIVPGKCDRHKNLVYKATESYFSELLKAGVKLYKYKDNFIHGKVLVIDSDIASIGTVNLDYRSFDLHFETTALIYDKSVVEDLISVLENDIISSQEIFYSQWIKRSRINKTLESIGHLFAPLL